jgi:hypothetical protein
LGFLSFFLSFFFFSWQSGGGAVGPSSRRSSLDGVALPADAAYAGASMLDRRCVLRHAHATELSEVGRLYIESCGLSAAVEADLRDCTHATFVSAGDNS